MTTESFQKRLECILSEYWCSSDQQCMDRDKAKKAILELLSETMPKERFWDRDIGEEDYFESKGFNAYRSELLKRWGVK